MAKAKSATIAGISDDAVKKATGKTWKQWMAALDKAGCRKLDHKSIAKLVHEKFNGGDWWSQMVTVGYEQATCKRVKHEGPNGFEISKTKVISVPVSTLYKAWATSAARNKWLDAKELKVRTATASKSMRLTWIDGEQIVALGFYPKGTGKSQVAVQHGKLKDAREAEKMKTYWAKKLEMLKAHLEG